MSPGKKQKLAIVLFSFSYFERREADLSDEVKLACVKKYITLGMTVSGI